MLEIVKCEKKWPQTLLDKILQTHFLAHEKDLGALWPIHMRDRRSKIIGLENLPKNNAFSNCVPSLFVLAKSPAPPSFELRTLKTYDNGAVLGINIEGIDGKKIVMFNWSTLWTKHSFCITFSPLCFQETKNHLHDFNKESDALLTC